MRELGGLYMTTIYLIRHAQATGNSENRVNGITDCDLTDKGYEQIKKLSTFSETLDIDAVYASPLKRAYKTAAALNWYINKPFNVIDNLREVNAGKWEGMLWDDINFGKQLYDLWIHDKEQFVADGGEPFPDVYKRMAETIDTIAEENDGKTVAIVGHGAAIRNFMCYAKRWEADKYPEQMTFGNTAFAKLIYDIDKKRYAVIYENEAPHLVN